MAYDISLARAVREALAGISGVTEKQMFQGLCFLVDGKLCLGVRDDELLCRLDPQDHEAIMERRGCREMLHSGRAMKGYVFVGPAGRATQSEFVGWIEAALAFNPRAKASPRRASAAKTLRQSGATGGPKH